MRALDELRGMELYQRHASDSAGGCVWYMPVQMGYMADRIEAEVSGHYLPLPTFWDGEPVRFGDEFEDGGERRIVGSIAYTPQGVTVGDGCGHEHRVGYFGIVPRPDSQGELEADAERLSARLADMTADEARAALTWLLARQRRISGEADDEGER